MPSIFIWKTDRSLPPNCSTIRYYHGVDWFLLENEDISYTYQYIAQDIFQEYIMYTVKSMRSDWVGEELLEVRTIPYHILYDTNGIRIQQLGSWLQCIYESDDENTETQWLRIKNILSSPMAPVHVEKQLQPHRVETMADHHVAYEQRGYRGRGGRGGRGGGGGRGARGGHGRGGYHGSLDKNRAIVTI